MPRRFLAVEFDSRQMRVALFDHGAKEPRVCKTATAAMPADMDLSAPEAVGEFLATMLAEASLPKVPLVMCVPRGQAVLNPLTLPPGTQRDEVAGMVQFQVQGEIPFAPEETVLDFAIEGEQIEGDASIGLNVLAAAVQTSTVIYYQAIADAAARPLARLGLRPYAVARCVEAAGASRADVPLAVVSITADETEIEILHGSHLAYSRSAVVKMDPDEAPPAIVQPDSDLPEDEKEIGLAAVLSQLKFTTPPSIDPVLAAKLQALVTEVTRSLQGYQAMCPDIRVGAILVAGGTGIESQVVSRLAGEVDMPVRLFDPAGSLPAKRQEHLDAFVACAGLGHGWGKDDRAPFDFLNPKRPVVRRDPALIRRVAVAVAASLLILILTISGFVWVGGKASRVNRLKSDVETAKDKAIAVGNLIDRVDQIRAWRDGRRAWLDHWANLSALLPGADEAYIDGLNTGDNYIRFTVQARNSETIEMVIDSLQKAGYKIKPKKDSLDPRNEHGYVRSAEVTLYFDPEPKVDLNALSPIRPEPTLQAPPDVPAMPASDHGGPQG